MTTSFRLPDLGEGVHEAEILAIPVAVGHAVREGETIIEVETDKAAVTIPSPTTGTVEEILVKVGDLAKVGDVLMTFSGAEASRPAPSDEASEPAATEERSATDSPQLSGKKRPVPASPATRRLARELGVDLHLVTPSDPGGVVSKDDVKRFAEQQGGVPEAEPRQETAEAPPAPIAPSGALPDFSQWGPIRREPFRSVRRATATQMAASWAQIPHVNCQDIADITKLEAFRQKHKEEIESLGGRLTMTVFALKAAATALKNYPYFNSSLDLDSQEIILKDYFHIGVAVDSEHGLMVPVIQDVDRKSIKEIAIELNEAIGRVRSRSHSREEMVGSTFTITNAGALGGSFFSAIVNYPEVAILGLGQGRMQPAVVTDDSGRQKIEPRLIMPIVLCFDHRVVDGGDAIRFLRLIIDALEDPDELLITMI